jgi:putative hydrolase of the HAD superfamily
MLVTKGHEAEQIAKLERSNLASYFSGVEVLPEKHEQAYRALAAHHRCDRSATWMIGNSPKSDINPALAAGLHAVFLPHEHTWQLEHEELDPVPAGQTLLELQTFAHLTRYF